MTLVIDSSVACKWYLDEELSLAARALADSDEMFIAPDLLLAEVGNVAWKCCRAGEIDEAQANEMLTHLPGMFLALLPARHLLSDAFKIAHELQHPIYDCFYLPAAAGWEAPLVAWDWRLLTPLEGWAWSHDLVSLTKTPKSTSKSPPPWSPSPSSSSSSTASQPIEWAIVLFRTGIDRSACRTP